MKITIDDIDCLYRKGTLYVANRFRKRIIDSPQSQRYNTIVGVNKIGQRKWHVARNADGSYVITFYWENKRYSTHTILNGKKHGEYIGWFTNGLRKSIKHYAFNEIYGTTQSWYRDGTRKSMYKHISKNCNKEKHWESDGSQIFSAYYINKILNGRLRQWVNGVRHEYYYRDGVEYASLADFIGDSSS